MPMKSTADGYTYRDQVVTETIGALDDAATLAIEDRDSFACQIGAGLTGSLLAEVSVDGGATWDTTDFLAKDDGAASSSLVDPSAGAYDIARTSGCSHVRVRCSTYGSGSCTVTLRGTETTPASAAGGGGGSGDASEATLQDVADNTAALAAATTLSVWLLSPWTPFDTTASGSAGQIGSGPIVLGPSLATNVNNEDCWILFKNAASYTGTTVFRLFVPAGDGTKRGAAEITIPITFSTGCFFKAVKTSDGSTAPSSALEFSGGRR